MTIRHAIWKVGAQPTALPATGLPSEQLLEEMIVAAPGLGGDEDVVGDDAVAGAFERGADVAGLVRVFRLERQDDERQASRAASRSSFSARRPPRATP